MGEKPIIFSSEMVRAILDNRKTQTRRVITQINKCREFITETKQFVAAQELLNDNPRAAEAYRVFCPYGAPGEKLWVRETCKYGGFILGMLVSYLATKTDIQEVMNVGKPNGWETFREKYSHRWCPSIFMPRWASRIILEIVSVRVQRVQDITDDDAEAESFLYFGETLTEPTPREKFREYWDKLNAKRGYIWIANPWVWAVEFKRLEK